MRNKMHIYIKIVAGMVVLITILFYWKVCYKNKIVGWNGRKR